MTSHFFSRRLASLCGILLLLLVSPFSFTRAGESTIVGPVGGAFGTSVTVLPNGNFVVVDPFYDFGVWTDSGAVYLFDGADPSGPPLTIILGIGNGEHIGSGGITVLSNGNFVIFSPDHNDASPDSGAVTWCSGTGGPSSVFVTAGNSLVGLSTGDMAGGKVVALKNGNYVVLSPGWDNAGAVDAGAVTWMDGATGTAAAIFPSNSLVGTSTGDAVGRSMTELPNGNYVVGSPDWNGSKGGGHVVQWHLAHRR